MTRIIPFILVLSAAAAAHAQSSQRCGSLVGGIQPTTLNPRLLAGTYDIEWHPTQRGEQRRLRQERLWLWQTTGSDSSTRDGGVKAAVGDTITYPLFGVTFPGTAKDVKSDSIRQSTDPIFPPVLLRIGWPRDTTGKTWPVLVLLFGTVANREPNLIAADGAGVVVHLDHVGADGFAGTYGPYGLALTDAGFLCARRVS